MWSPDASPLIAGCTSSPVPEVTVETAQVVPPSVERASRTCAWPPRPSCQDAKRPSPVIVRVGSSSSRISLASPRLRKLKNPGLGMVLFTVAINRSGPKVAPPSFETKTTSLLVSGVGGGQPGLAKPWKNFRAATYSVPLPGSTSGMAPMYWVKLQRLNAGIRLAYDTCHVAPPSVERLTPSP